ncbi:MAG: hypothetical protein BRD51_03570 [Bacteroidetes bacterium SW_11_64_17]|nr:MAG: hypothetical protein BRD51_03570 [Bacteroidetes bacterium SW_11_64_17]
MLLKPTRPRCVSGRPRPLTTPKRRSLSAPIRRGGWADLEDVRDAFLDTIDQVPPMYSAVRVNGERLYEKTRRGETVERAPRQVQIHQLEFTEWAPPALSLRVECSKGTYVRGLA